MTNIEKINKVIGGEYKPEQMAVGMLIQEIMHDYDIEMNDYEFRLYGGKFLAMRDWLESETEE